jgi:hypothetical protein
MSKYWAGHTCPETATYGQYHDPDNKYAGAVNDKRVEMGKTFPPSLNNHHYQKK